MSDTSVQEDYKVVVDGAPLELAEPRQRRGFSWGRIGFGLLGLLGFLAIWQIAAAS